MNGPPRRGFFTTCTGIALSVAGGWQLIRDSAAGAAMAATPVAAQGRIRRQEAATDVVTGTVMRVDPAAKVTPGVRIADYLKRSGTERPLSRETIDELTVLLRSDKGFDDSIVKRCRPGTSVGIVLTRKAANAREEENELVLDFGCEKLMLTGAGSTADVHATDFGPSRSAFVELVKRALPHDRELRKLR